MRIIACKMFAGQYNRQFRQTSPVYYRIRFFVRTHSSV